MDLDARQEKADLLAHDREIIDEWFGLGSDVLAVPAGAVLGFFISGPIGGAVGTTVASVLARGLRLTGIEVWERYMSRRERVRIARVVLMAANEMQKRIAEGCTIREDDFFEPKPPYKSDLEEVVESLLLRVQREPEERKLPYLAKLLASIALNADIDVGFAHQLLRFGNDLSYRQYCILALTARKSLFDLFEGPCEGLSFELINSQLSFLSDCYELRELGLLRTGTAMDWSMYEVRPAALILEPLGFKILESMGLLSIPMEDVASAADLFVYGKGNIPPRSSTTH